MDKDSKEPLKEAIPSPLKLRDMLEEMAVKELLGPVGGEYEEVIQTATHYLGFCRVTESALIALKSAINSAIRQSILNYEDSFIWREI